MSVHCPNTPYQDVSSPSQMGVCLGVCVGVPGDCFDNVTCFLWNLLGAQGTGIGSMSEE